MTTQANIPLKWYVPFANGDASRVEIPVTTADPTRASQTLGFPPLTMQPPESGGVPPQGEDFNGGMNQIARVAWWVLNGGGWPYDASFATNGSIGGYPNGATLQAADFRGDWINTADNNQNNPDTTGTGWVPGFQYGVTSLTGLTGGTVTPTPAQAAKNSITLSGTLGSALTIVLPAWLKNWTITNNTTGAFVTIVKTAAGSGVTINQGAIARVTGDGTNILLPAEQNSTGRLLNVQVFTTSGTYTPTPGTLKVKVRCVGGGGGGGGIQTTAAVAAAGGGGGGGGGAEGLFNITGPVAVVIGAGGQGGQLSNGWSGLAGGTSSFGAFCSATGGGGGVGAGNQTAVVALSGAGGGLGSNGYLQCRGNGGGDATIANQTAGTGVIGGNGGGGAFFGGGVDGGSGSAGGTGTLCGEGGAGGSVTTTGAVAGGDGAKGIIVIEEYA